MKERRGCGGIFLYFLKFTLIMIINWRTEIKVLGNPGQIFPDLCEDCVSVVTAAPALHGGAEAPGDEAHQGPAVVSSVLSHQRPSGVSLPPDWSTPCQRFTVC